MVAAGADDAGLVGEDDRLDAVAEVELVEHAGDVGLDRERRDDELFGDLGVGEAARDEHEDLALARRSARRGRVAGAAAGRVVADEGLDQPPGDRRGEQRVALGDRVDRGQEVLGRDVLEQEAAGAGDERVEHVLVEVEGGEHQHPRGRLARRGAAASPRARP